MRFGHPAREIVQEDFSVLDGPLADQPRRHQLRVGADRGQGPHVAVAGRALELLRDVLLLRVAEAPDLVGLDHLAGEVWSAPSWNSAQASPRSTSSLVIVFLAAPVIRTVARMLLPSTRQPMIWARFSVLSLFILTIMRKHSDGTAGLAGEVQTPGRVASARIPSLERFLAVL